MYQEAMLPPWSFVTKSEHVPSTVRVFARCRGEAPADASKQRNPRIPLTRVSHLSEAHFNFLLNLALSSKNIRLLEVLARFPRKALAKQAASTLALRLKQESTDPTQQEQLNVILLEDGYLASLEGCNQKPDHHLLASFELPVDDLVSWYKSGIWETLLLNSYPKNNRDQEITQTWYWLANYLGEFFSILVLRVDELALESLWAFREIPSACLLIAVHSDTTTAQLQTLWERSADYTISRLISLHPLTTLEMREQMTLEATHSW